MMRRVGFFGLSVLLAAAGYGSVALWERGNVWNDDDALVAMVEPIRTRPQNDRSPLERSDRQNGLQFVRDETSGIDFRYENGAAGEFHLAETLGGGIGATDFDRDGRVDLMFVDGGDPINWPSQSRKIVCYRNDGAARFDDVSTAAHCDWAGYGHGCAAGDVNNDGFDDLFLTGYGSTALLINLGDGTFVETTGEAGLQLDRWCATSDFGDLDRDGDLDLYVTAYADTPARLPAPHCESGGVRIHCHPHHYDPVSDAVFENLGNGQFADRSASSGVAQHRQYGLGVVVLDLDHDLTPEIFVANDGDRNLLFEQVSDWTFREIATTAGVAFNSQGESMGAMGIAAEDFDGNGLVDLLTANFVHERNVVFSNAGGLGFFDRSQGDVIDRTSRQMVGWSAVPLDADADGVWDLFIANGHVTDDPLSQYAQQPLLYRGSPGGWQVAADAGDYFTRPHHGRGAVATDVDQDGRPDLVVSHIRERAAVLRNVSTSRGRTIRLQLVGTASNRSAATARVELEAGEDQFVHQLRLSGGYLCSSTAPILLSLGEATSADSLTIIWPSGTEQTFLDVPADRSLIVREGRAPLRRP